MKLYNANLSPNATRVRGVVNELAIPMEVIDVDLRKGENRTPEYLALNPNGKVPVLVDGDFVLWESRAINAYLAAMKPERGLYPADLRTRAIVDQWSYWGAVHFGPAIQRVVFERLLKKRFGRGEPDEAAIEAQVKEVEQLVPILDAQLAGKEWIAGSLTLADFAIASTLVYRSGSGISLADAPNVAAWADRIEARPSWKAAIAPGLQFVAG
jgi:glutathione S-transferase